MRRRSPAARLKVDFQILGGGKIGFDADHAVKLLGQCNGEKADAGEQVQRQSSAAVANHSLDQRIDQEPVDLKEGKMTDPKPRIASQVRQVAGSDQFKFVGAAVLHQNRRNTWNGVAQRRSDRFR